MAKQHFKVCGIFDTETTTLGEGLDSVAFACLYIINDVRDVEISAYEPNVSDGIEFFRHSSDMIAWIEELVQWGIERDIVPVVCAYNLAFDMQTLIYELNKRYGMNVLAQSSTSYYTLDLMGTDGKPVLRFWDTFYLEMNGLSAMGRTCGLAKAEGYWDYTKVRHHNTPLTEDELLYASRDVQVIPAYLRWLLKANEYVKESDLGVRVLTKTSLVRLLGTRKIGRLTPDDGSNLFNYFRFLCKGEMEKSYRQYALRKACFRGGLTFTSGNYAGELYRNVASFDVVSMHHTFINGRHIPWGFKSVSRETLQFALQRVANTTLEQVLERYYEPFSVAFNVAVRVKNVRPKRKSVFEKAGIWTLPFSKFGRVKYEVKDFEALDVRNLMLENAYRETFCDTALKPTFAFGKLVSAQVAAFNFTEIEWWIFNQVYDFDDWEVLEGESTARFKKPPAYVSLMSNLLFEQKTVVKNVLSTYHEGTPYPEPTDLELLPDGIRNSLLDGTCEKSFLESYYTSTIKGGFNSVYGTMAQDIYKPQFDVRKGDILVDKATIPNDTNFEKVAPKQSKVLYTYGARIVAGSRMHLVIAMMLIDKALRGVKILGGDTDSLKIALGKHSEDDILEALKPLHEACVYAMDVAQDFIRTQFPTYASDFHHVGFFECEGIASSHVELWNKARISYADGHAKVTLAGVPRPPNFINVETYVERYVARHGEESLPRALGYNFTFDKSISYFLGVARPKVSDRFTRNVTDYLGNIAHVDDYAAIALYRSDKEIGSTLARVNHDNVEYVKSRGRHLDIDDRTLRLEGDTIILDTDFGSERYASTL